MEGAVKEIQAELSAIKKDRLDLYNMKLSTGLIVSGPSAETMLLGSPRMPIQKCRGDTRITQGQAMSQQTAVETDQALPPDQSNTPPEGYMKLAELREELIRAKSAADAERFKREKYENKLKDWDSKLNKQAKKRTDEDMTALKTQVRDLKEEVEELKITQTEKNEQLQEYRMKYLQAQQQVEEHRRQLDVIEYDNKQVSDQIQIEIQSMKMQFQEKLQVLAALPDLLKGAQIQLQEAKQLQRLAEERSQQLSDELHLVNEKLVIAVNNLNQVSAANDKLNDENKFLKSALEEKRKENEEVTKSLDEFKCNAMRVDEKLIQQEIRYNEKVNECAKLLNDLEELRVENVRALSRSKERSDSMRRYLQSQISELERQLIQSRAHCRACQKDRDEIRQRMQIQMNNLQESFELSEIRLRALQNQVTSLKNSYSAVLSENEEMTVLSKISQM